MEKNKQTGKWEFLDVTECYLICSISSSNFSYFTSIKSVQIRQTHAEMMCPPIFSHSPSSNCVSGLELSRLHRSNSTTYILYTHYLHTSIFSSINEDEMSIDSIGILDKLYKPVVGNNI